VRITAFLRNGQLLCMKTISRRCRRADRRFSLSRHYATEDQCGRPGLAMVIRVPRSEVSRVYRSSLEFHPQAFEEQSHRRGRSTGKDHRTASHIVPRDHRKESENRRQSRISADPGDEPDRRAVEAEPDHGNHEQPGNLLRAREATTAKNERAAKQI